MADLLVLHGPNLNLLGSREPELYGHQTLAEINQTLKMQAEKLGHAIQFFQSNAEYELITCIHQAKNNNIQFILFNPAAFTHTSIALRDALLAVHIPFIEIHLSNPCNREGFRKTSYFGDIAQGIIAGFGEYSYILALNAAHHLLQQPNESYKH